MSKKSDDFEYLVAESLQHHLGSENALRPKVGTKYSDVKFKYGDDWHWLEVKMEHRCNLMNSRFYFDDKQWKSVNTDQSAALIVSELNSSVVANNFIQELCEYSKTPWDEITIRRGRDYGEIDLGTMRGFLSQKDHKYIIDQDGYHLGRIATLHYTQDKAEPVHYIQCSDDFYMIGNSNPIGFDNVLEFDGTGPLRVRVSTRSRFYEIQAEVKIKTLANSHLSVLKNSNKENPFENLRSRS